MLIGLLRFMHANLAYRLICSILCLSFIATTMPVSAQVLPYMPPVGQMVVQSQKPYSVPYIVGMQFSNDNIFDFTFFFNRGDSPAQDSILRAQVNQASKYFLAALTIPEKDLWVNLSPYEQERIIAPELSRTDLGKDLLGEDYVLKQLASSLTHPDSESGKKFWEMSAKQGDGSKGEPNVLNKVWIVPDVIRMKESPEGVVITQATLKVLTEEDYLAIQKNSPLAPSLIKRGNAVAGGVDSAAAMRDAVVPLIEKEVNTGKHFAQLRQAYYSIIIAGWFKKKLKDTVLNQIYFNQKKTGGAENNDPTLKEKIYNEYVQAFKQGVYKVIKTERSMAKLTKRTYFSGGARLEAAATAARNAAPATVEEVVVEIAKAGGTVERGGIEADMSATAQGTGFDNAETLKEGNSEMLDVVVTEYGVAVDKDDKPGMLAAAKKMQTQNRIRGGRFLLAIANSLSNVTDVRAGRADLATARQAAEAIENTGLRDGAMRYVEKGEVEQVALEYRVAVDKDDKPGMLAAAKKMQTQNRIRGGRFLLAIALEISHYRMLQMCAQEERI
jgi:hypothetical protein